MFSDCPQKPSLTLQQGRVAQSGSGLQDEPCECSVKKVAVHLGRLRAGVGYEGESTAQPEVLTPDLLADMEENKTRKDDAIQESMTSGAPHPA